MNTYDFNAIRAARHYQNIEYQVDPDDGILWIYLNPAPHPCVSPELVDDMRALQTILETNSGNMPAEGRIVPIRYHVLDSKTPGAFCLGGDLAFFLRCRETGDREAITRYARNCINAIYPIMVNFNMPLLTVSLVRGHALGGGFEIALSGDVIIAERSVQMGFPEILFNMFPGMGAFQMLSRRIGLHHARKMITGGKLYGAEELFDLGIVDVLAEDGCGEQAVYNYIQNQERHWNGLYAIQQVMLKLQHYDHAELLDICCNEWANAVFGISEKDIRTMSRFVRSQRKYAADSGMKPAALTAAI